MARARQPAAPAAAMRWAAQVVAMRVVSPAGESPCRCRAARSSAASRSPAVRKRAPSAGPRHPGSRGSRVRLAPRPARRPPRAPRPRAARAAGRRIGAGVRVRLRAVGQDRDMQPIRRRTACAIRPPQPRLSSSGCGASTRSGPGPAIAARSANGSAAIRARTSPALSAAHPVAGGQPEQRQLAVDQALAHAAGLQNEAVQPLQPGTLHRQRRARLQPGGEQQGGADAQPRADRAAPLSDAAGQAARIAARRRRGTRSGPGGPARSRRSARPPPGRR